ncbi:type VII secretion-associated serine protease mycosin [Smaragdicoccus niigatensis]|uniref:type VII secretion-associated serine protease mycosin n=1 Tax=Smaragdicoccus niigatensis TaxID=359359 RepID=UPI0003683622|nr:type VII secretion-associated serine protease mycosin [Smaragdicoccus niigatensis]
MRIRQAVTVATTLVLIASPIASAERPPDPNPADLPGAAAPSPSAATQKRSECAEPLPLDPADSVEAALPVRELWDLTRGAGQKVAVIDTGVAHHPRLKNLIGGGDYVTQSDGTEDCDAHGTLVAGLIAATPSDSDGFAGIAPDATILSIRQSSAAYSYTGGQSNQSVSNSKGVGTVGSLARAIRYAADSGATVINLSEVACAPDMNDASLGAAVQYAAVVKDVVIVAAAGNNDVCHVAEGGQRSWESVRTIVSPAWYDEYVLTVGSVGPSGQASPFTVPGPWVDMAAPGERVVSLDPRTDGLTNAIAGTEGQRLAINGTSFAAPLVSGTAALIRARFPELRARDVIALIEATAHAPARGWDQYVGFGVVDPGAAVTAVDPAHIASPRKPGSDRADGRPIPIPDLPSETHVWGRNLALLGTASVLGLLALGLVAAPRRKRR